MEQALENVNAVNDAQEANVEPSNNSLPLQTKAENSAYAAMRKAKAKAETQREEIGRENSEIKKELEKKESELENLRRFKSERLIEDDIALIKKEYPQFEIDPKNLPEDFLRIMATGAVDALTAAEIIMARKEKAKITAPENIGAVNESTVQDKEFYTSAEVDKLTKADFRKNPDLLRKIQKSMTKWR